YLKDKLLLIKASSKAIADIRGEGLMLGAQVKGAGAPVVAECQKNGLLLNCTNHNVIRFLPPLNVSKEEIDEALGIFEAALKSNEMSSS
ncbi:MAG: aminotransferase class III-fold pyridoxal phosphate-dependent enzyme, partial [bacterium]|nr:aminotransferase class III-fold pyridoxal phosphate-dependent enzyme [bacterium]